MYHNNSVASTYLLWYIYTMPKKRGRPKTPRTEALAKFLSIRMRPDEGREVLDAIRKSGQAKSDWIRGALLGAARRTSEP